MTGAISETLTTLGIGPADILLPKDCDMTKWAVVACDQFTSQPDYWYGVDRLVGASPSTLRLILPEFELHDKCLDAHIDGVNAAMHDYLDRGLFRELTDSVLFIRRVQADGAVRCGVVAQIDLETYSYTPGSDAKIRATEALVIERLPPRIRVRRNAPIELPHVMLLIDDPEKSCIEPLSAETDGMEPLYDFDLMMGGGHLSAWRLSEGQKAALWRSFAALIDPDALEARSGLRDAAPLLFAVGDGNHSLAAAKACYEEQKKTVPASEWAHLPSRYALAEVVNLHSDALQFEAIHRVLFGVSPEKVIAALRERYPNAYEGCGEGHQLDLFWGEQELRLTIPDPKLQLAVGTLQTFLDEYVAAHGGEIDYIHGDEVARELAKAEGNLAILLPPLRKEQLFKTVMLEGVLPRKTFSMGGACDKRYYVEARKIR